MVPPLTLGGPGTAVTLGSGATQAGFGRAGTVDWCTTAKTSPFAVSRRGFLLIPQTEESQLHFKFAFSRNIVAFKDYANTWERNAVTICGKWI